jgi:hypothetical protein
MFSVGSFVLFKPYQVHSGLDQSEVFGFVYSDYMLGDKCMYVLLTTKRPGIAFQNNWTEETESLSKEILCQHVPETLILKQVFP